MVAYLGTNNFKEVCERALNGDEKARLVSEAAAYQVAREIGAMAAVLAGKVDAIILTGGMTFQDSFVEQIKTLTGFIARIVVYPGEDEMKALALSGLLALDGSMEIKTYT
jgi:butyrate kinase